ncbi:MAG: BamA/TamA family outer membrane protein [Planctomycetia bacterium]|nr:BamA/TamA family outer membrane protein [Planctomycetia bacterium]
MRTRKTFILHKSSGNSRIPFLNRETSFHYDDEGRKVSSCRSIQNITSTAGDFIRKNVKVFLLGILLGCFLGKGVFAWGQYITSDSPADGSITSVYHSALSYENATNAAPAPGTFNPSGSFGLTKESSPSSEKTAVSSGYVSPFSGTAASSSYTAPESPGDLLHSTGAGSARSMEILSSGGQKEEIPGGNQGMMSLGAQTAGNSSKYLLTGDSAADMTLPAEVSAENLNAEQAIYKFPVLDEDRKISKTTTGREYEGKIVADVRIVGNSRISVERIMQHIFTRVGRPFSTEVFEQDLRRMNQSRLFVLVEPHLQNASQGVVVIFRVTEQHIMEYLHFQGNEKLRVDTLKKECGLYVGKPFSPYDVEEGRKRLEAYYHSKGYARCVITVAEGSKNSDLGVIYVINEGPKFYIGSTKFIGNKITSSARLRTVIMSKASWLPGAIFQGQLQEDVVNEDVKKLQDYYRRLGFFNATISRWVRRVDENGRCEVIFVINEGPQYKIRDIKYIGNDSIEADALMEDMKVFVGKPFNKDRMDQSIAKVRKRYGRSGYVFADINADIRFLEEPGELDIVFQIKEGKTYRVGRVNVLIDGEYPHTQVSTILNRLSVKPGDLIDSSKLRDSEVRLRASQLFAVDPMEGKMPKVVYSPPEMLQEKQIAKQIGSDADSVGNKASAARSNSGSSAGKASLGGAGSAALQGSGAVEHKVYKYTVMEPDKHFVLAENEEWLDITIIPARKSGRGSKPSLELTFHNEQNEKTDPVNKSYAEIRETVLQENRRTFAVLEEEDYMGEFLPDGRISVANDDPQYALPEMDARTFCRPLKQAEPREKTSAEISCNLPKKAENSGTLLEISPPRVKEHSYGTRTHGVSSGISEPGRYQVNYLNVDAYAEDTEQVALYPIPNWRPPQEQDENQENLRRAANDQEYAHFLAKNRGTASQYEEKQRNVRNTAAYMTPEKTSENTGSSASMDSGRGYVNSGRNSDGVQEKNVVDFTGRVTPVQAPVNRAYGSVAALPPSTSERTGRGNTAVSEMTVRGNNVSSGSEFSADTPPATSYMPSSARLSMQNNQVNSGRIQQEQNLNSDADSLSPPPAAEAPIHKRVGQSVMSAPAQPGIRNTDITPFTQRPADPPAIGYSPEDWVRQSLPISVQTDETTTGKLMFSLGLSTEAGLVGSVVVDEQNFDITRWPRSFQDIRNSTAWRGAGQRFRMELAPGTEVQRYTVSFDEPYLFNSQIGLGTSAMYYDRYYRNWTETRLGGQISLSRALTYDLRAYLGFRGYQVKLFDIDAGAPERILDAQGSSALYGFSFRLVQDRRDNMFLATEGYYASLEFEQVIGTWVYPRFNAQFKKYWLLAERADMSGRHVLSISTTFAWSGDNTPVYESYFAGGSSTLRGFRFRDASPKENDMSVGGNMMILASVEYLFPITADDSIRGVIFCDTGTVERYIDDWKERYRVSVGAGLRISMPMLGSAPIALDFAIPVSKNPWDVEQIFSFTMGMQR